MKAHIKSVFIIVVLITSYFYYRSTSGSLQTQLPKNSTKTFLPKKISRRPPLTRNLRPKPSQDGMDDIDEPWDELTNRWDQLMRDYLVQHDPENADQIYSSYIEEREIYSKAIQELVDERETTIVFSEATDHMDYIDKDRYSELNLQIKALAKQHKVNSLRILNNHYLGLKVIYKDFEEEIQVYSKGEYRIGADGNFDEF